MRSWYRDEGVQAVMSCGGGMAESVVRAARETGGKVIGVDADLALQYGDVILTSACKNMCSAVMNALAIYYGGTLRDYPDCEYHTGITDGGVTLPAASWTMTQYTPTQHAAMRERFENGDYAFTDDLDKAEDAACRTNLDVTVD